MNRGEVCSILQIAMGEFVGGNGGFCEMKF